MVTDHINKPKALANIESFWWVFALRGGFAVLFAGVLFYSGNLFGTIFFDPIMIVILGVLLGFYVLGNGVLLGVAGIVAYEHKIHLWRLMLWECAFALLLGVYIGFSLSLSKESLALLAGIHACGVGGFQLALAIKLRHERNIPYLLTPSGVVSIGVSATFLLHRSEELKTVTLWLGAFELFFGLTLLLLALGLRRRFNDSPPQVVTNPPSLGS